MRYSRRSGHLPHLLDHRPRRRPGDVPPQHPRPSPLRV